MGPEKHLSINITHWAFSAHSEVPFST